MVSTLGAPGVPAEAQAGQVPALEVVGLTKTYSVGKMGKPKVVRALTNVDLCVARREIVGLVGESGSGKSTFARTVAFLERPTSGTVKVDGVAVPLGPGTADLRAHRRRVQMIFQDPYTSLDPLHKIRYAVGRPLESLAGLPKGLRRDRMEQVLGQVGLVPPADFLNRYPYQLSGGQRQRVGIARALAAQPTLLLADEPTSMLDVSIRLNIMNLLLDLRESQSLSMLFVTHDLAGASYMSDRMAIMYAGHLVELGPSAEVMGQPRHPYTQLLRQAAPDPSSQFGRDTSFEARGDPPDLTELPPGCPFAARCTHVRDDCRTALPPWRQVADGHQVRCVLYGT